MTPDELKARSKRFALAIIAKTQKLSHTLVAQVISRQLVSAATSTAANYRAACRARSRQEFAAKLGIAEEEADESQFWLEMLVDAGLLMPRDAQALIAEAGELVAILAASRKTVRTGNPKVGD